MSYHNQGYNNYRHERRINEDDVPESKHTIFIRGLPGSMSTDEIKDYFEDKIGPVSFDFVKTSQDQARLFVAVRFESREDAKTAMNKYADRDFLGYQCQISWFKDIRRFAQYQQTHGGGNSGGGGGNNGYQVRGGGFRGRGVFRGRGGNFRGGYNGDRDYDRDRRRRDSDRDRSSRSRSRSRSSRRSSRSRSRSRSSVERSRSRSPRSRSRSPRRSESRDRRSRSRDSDASAASRNSSRRSRRDKKKNRKRSRRSPSHSAVSSDEGELHSDADRRRNGSRASRSASPKQPIAAPIQTPPPLPQIKVNLKTTREDLEIPVPPPAAVAPVTPAVVIPTVVTPTVDVSKMSFSIGMDSDEILQKTPSATSVIVPSEEPPRPPQPPQQPPVAAEYTPCPPRRVEPAVIETAPLVQVEKKPIVVNLPPPPCPPSMMANSQSPMATRGMFRPLDDAVEEPARKKERLEEPALRQNPYNSWTPVDSKEDLRENGHAQKAPSTSTQFPTCTRLFAELHDFQAQLVRSVKAEKKEETFGLTLSTFSTEDEDDSRKKMAREQKLAAMDEFDLERFSVTKKKFENAFKNDCNTYAIVIRKLLSKNESLEKPLRMALMETMEDLEKQFMEKIDNHLGIY